MESNHGDKTENEGPDFVEKVRQWLVKTGYPLEMRVAQEFRKLEPTLIQQGVNYKDGETGKIRESDIDVFWLAMTPGTLQSISLQVIVECKAGTQPWIMFADPDDTYIDVAHYGFAVAASAEPDDGKFVVTIHDKLIELGVPLFEGPAPLCYGIVQMKRDSDTDKNEAYDSVRQAASGAAATVSDFRPNREPVSLAYSVPVVVTTHPLFMATSIATIRSRSQ